MFLEILEDMWSAFPLCLFTSFSPVFATCKQSTKIFRYDLQFHYTLLGCFSFFDRSCYYILSLKTVSFFYVKFVFKKKLFCLYCVLLFIMISIYYFLFTFKNASYTLSNFLNSSTFCNLLGLCYYGSQLEHESFTWFTAK